MLQARWPELVIQPIGQEELAIERGDHQKVSQDVSTCSRFVSLQINHHERRVAVAKLEKSVLKNVVVATHMIFQVVLRIQSFGLTFFAETRRRVLTNMLLIVLFILYASPLSTPATFSVATMDLQVLARPNWQCRLLQARNSLKRQRLRTRLATISNESPQSIRTAQTRFPTSTRLVILTYLSAA